jgi:hypothetical protein
MLVMEELFGNQVIPGKAVLVGANPKVAFMVLGHAQDEISRQGIGIEGVIPEDPGLKTVPTVQPVTGGKPDKTPAVLVYPVHMVVGQAILDADVVKTERIRLPCAEHIEKQKKSPCCHDFSYLSSSTHVTPGQ